MDLFQQQAQENIVAAFKELFNRPDFEAFVKSQSKEEFSDTFFALMKVYIKYNEYSNPENKINEKILQESNNEIIKITEKIFEGIGSGVIAPQDFLKVIKGGSTEEELAELGKKFAFCFEESSEEKPQGGDN